MSGPAAVGQPARPRTQHLARQAAAVTARISHTSTTDGRSRVLFIEVPEPKTGKNRRPFDLRPTDGTREREVERLLGLGATPVADHRRPYVHLLAPR